MALEIANLDTGSFAWEHYLQEPFELWSDVPGTEDYSSRTTPPTALEPSELPLPLQPTVTSHSRQTVRELYARSIRAIEHAPMLMRDRVRLLTAVSSVNMMIRDEGSVSNTSHDSQSTPATSVTTSSSLPNECLGTAEGETGDPQPHANNDTMSTD